MEDLWPRGQNSIRVELLLGRGESPPDLGPKMLHPLVLRDHHPVLPVGFAARRGHLLQQRALLASTSIAESASANARSAISVSAALVIAMGAPASAQRKPVALRNCN